MSLNFAVDGKFMRNCGRQPSVLEDSDRVRKELESERRRQRLQQVREESRHLARKIRTDVANEKDRQLRQLEAVKAQELNCWRQSVLAQQHQDYRSAIFQVGSAHEAAQLENQQRAIDECARANAHNAFRKQLKARRSCQTPPSKVNRKPLHPIKQTKSACTQTSTCQPSTPRPAGGACASTAPTKRKHNVGFHNCVESHSCGCSKQPAENNENEHDDDDADDTADDSTLSDTTSCGNSSDWLSSPKPAKCTAGLHKTPAVFLDVEVDSCDSITITAPCEIKDNHVTSNRQFSRVVRHSPEKPAPAKKNAKPPQTKPPPKNTKAPPTKSPLKKSSKTKLPPQKTPPKKTPPKKAPPPQRTPQKKKPDPVAKAPRTYTPYIPECTACTPICAQQPAAKPRLPPRSCPPPRFTQVSDLLQRKKPQPAADRQLPIRVPSAPSTSPVARQSPRSERQSPRSTHQKPVCPPAPSTRPPAVASKCTQVESAATSGSATTMKSSQTSTACPPDTAPTTKHSNATVNVESSSSLGTGTATGTGTGTATNTGGRVQFYDYNNKFCKDYPQPTSAVQIGPLDATAPNAMEQASIETGIRQAREREIELLRKKSDERGQKALEREQIRRDCGELTEKLDALTRQQPRILVHDPNLLPSHHFTDQAARREQQMNAVVEEALLRPAIITCPVIGDSPHVQPQSQPHARVQRKQPPAGFSGARGTRGAASTELNVGTHELVTNQTAGSDSCCSILLGYVDDQSAQLRDDLSQCGEGGPPNPEKTGRLRALLQRIEQLRESLLAELSGTSGAPSGNGNAHTHRTSISGSGHVQQVIDSISDVRREREHLLTQDQRGRAPQRPAGKPADGKCSEKRAAELERQMRQVCEMLKDDGGGLQVTKAAAPAVPVSAPGASSAKQGGKRTRPRSDKPLEIVIKVQGQQQGRGGRDKQKSARGPSQLATLARPPLARKKPARKPPPAVASRPAQQLQPAKSGQDRGDECRNSYDSNSTAYRSLPPELSNHMEALLCAQAHAQAQVQAQNPDDAPDDEPGAATRRCAQLNPLLAHYVQRLLGMSRNSILTLGVSSSDVETPASSVINTPSNRACEPPDTADAQLSADRLERVQRFVADNRSFVQELESTLLSRSNMSLDASLRAIEDMWKQRLCGRSGDESANGSPPARQQAVTKQQPAARQQPKRQMKSAGGRQVPLEPPAANADRPAQRQPVAGKCVPSAAQGSSGSRNPPLPPTQTQQQQKTVGVQFQQPDSSSEAQMERYAQLTRNCTERIDELSELIGKVRQEKQRLLEVTLSSVSENGRNSTEYNDLPDTLKRCPDGSERTLSTDSASATASGSASAARTTPSASEAAPPAQPLEKHKQTGASRDSGISLSRPMTAQEEHRQEQDPASVSSSTHTLSASSAHQQLQQQPQQKPPQKPQQKPQQSQQSQQNRSKPRPPATMRRFSPLLPEDETAHELSTILEVETPATSRVNTSIQRPPAASSTGVDVAADAAPCNAEPIAFPTFEEYARQLNLDLTQIDPEQSMRIHQEFNELICALKNAEENKDLSYKEFPSLSAYLQNTTLTTSTAEGQQPSQEQREQQQQQHTMASEQLDDLLECLRLANLTVRSFPTQKEYMQRLATNTPERELIDSTSLENVSTEQHTTSTSGSTGSTSLNIEEELRRRNILQGSFLTATAPQQRVVSSTCHSDGASGSTASGAGAAPAPAERGAGAKRNERTALHARLITAESGVDKLSTSDNLSGELERELHGIGLAWTATMRKKTRAAAALSSSSTSSSNELCKQQKPPPPSSQQQQQERDCSATYNTTLGDTGRPLSLHDFITRELLKRANSTCSSNSYTDDSLRSQFLHSIIDSMTPSASPRTTNMASNGNTATTAANRTERQKTSTPVLSHSTPSSGSRSRGGAHGTGQGTTTTTATNTSSSTTSTSQLFSGESRLSSVHFQDHSSTRFFCQSDKEPPSTKRDT